MEKPYTFKGQSLENRPSCIFQAIGNILVAEAATKVKAKKKPKKKKTKKKTQNGTKVESDLFFPLTRAGS